MSESLFRIISTTTTDSIEDGSLEFSDMVKGKDVVGRRSPVWKMLLPSPQEYIDYVNFKLSRYEQERVFWNRVNGHGDDCWIWGGRRDELNGYGIFKWNGRDMGAHRVSFYLTHNDWPIVVRHRCDAPLCVNPNHLLAGNHKDNYNDMVSRGRDNPGGRKRKGKTSKALGI